MADIKQLLLASLDGIKSSGSFAASGNLSIFVDPKIDIPGVGTVGLPLNDKTADAVIKKCHQAPFGKGENTVVDKSIRNTWELNANEFKVQNSVWAEYVKQITSAALKELGFDEQRAAGVRAELYKMLLYEKGALFKPHKE
jgi:hypothetical protein